MKKSKVSPYGIELIDGKKEWFCVIIILVLICIINLGIKYYQFSNLNFTSPQEIFGQIILQYPKTKEKELKSGLKKINHYFVLKISDFNGNIFYATTKEDIKNIINRYGRFYGQLSKCNFIQFLKSCYLNVYSISLLHQRDYRDKIRDFIDFQHPIKSIESVGLDKPTNQKYQENLVGNLYRALFIADPLHKSWRDLSNTLGLAHIIAISGFHLGILSAFLYALFCPFYRYFQKRYFPYRNEAYDLGSIILAFMFAYLLLLDYQPSFFRSFVMAAMGFLVYFSGVRLVSFPLLFFVCLFCIAFSPSIIFNIGFILSVAGVFYIFLFMRHFPKISKIPYWICFNFAIFWNIAPIVHYFFPYFSPYQLISIPVGIVFVVFFPLSLVLHFFHWGYFLDDFFWRVLPIKPPFIEYYAPWWLTCSYVVLSLWSIKSQKTYWILNLFSLAFFVFLVLKYLYFL
ncbi:ComEC/Rec2 family competence protein [Helicobacter cappadocius]|uniref:ComEC/Rec2 family competence protein n=1 Tax=Helicobacter cappadocius TaxID=3063998 RepID=A0AA90PZJ7_9HELI|nr:MULTISPECIES: ComEC/Rec2 family competence protein [unclassified Helicobacter]MDO7253491.1 ComEC/Rec2 family competence protein [Helicobacter sp. faydin-H75]MDP2539418.1 ComEC/Rec2 family competence protein [Helicobacter sp. faydin-H76]